MKIFPNPISYYIYKAGYDIEFVSRTFCLFVKFFKIALIFNNSWSSPSTWPQIKTQAKTSPYFVVPITIAVINMSVRTNTIQNHNKQQQPIVFKIHFSGQKVTTLVLPLISPTFLISIGGSWSLFSVFVKDEAASPRQRISWSLNKYFPLWYFILL